MIVLLKAWSDNPGIEVVDWAVLSLTKENIEQCLDRIATARKMYETDINLFGIEFWSASPLWIGHCEIWDKVYTDAVQIIGTERLQPGQHGNVSVECSTIVVTQGGVEWHATVRGTSAHVETAELPLEQLQQMQKWIEWWGDE